MGLLVCMGLSSAAMLLWPNPNGSLLMPPKPLLVPASIADAKELSLQT